MEVPNIKDNSPMVANNMDNMVPHLPILGMELLHPKALPLVLIWYYGSGFR
jgi:hypothetical protein